MTDPKLIKNAAQFKAVDDDTFARIAGKYNFLCDIFSFGIHRYWKGKMAKAIASCQGDLVFDAASGTGDIPIRLLKKHPTKKIIVADLCPEMLDVAKDRLEGSEDRVAFLKSNATNLRMIEDNSVDIYTIAFGLKVMNRAAALQEAFRILKPGGIFLCLEASEITIKPLHKAYLKYMALCLPLMAKIAVGGDKGAYDYLLRGIESFPNQDNFVSEMRSAGFRGNNYKNMSMGIAAIHKARKPESQKAKP